MRSSGLCRHSSVGVATDLRGLESPARSTGPPRQPTTSPTSFASLSSASSSRSSSSSAHMGSCFMLSNRWEDMFCSVQKACRFYRMWLHFVPTRGFRGNTVKAEIKEPRQSDQWKHADSCLHSLFISDKVTCNVPLILLMFPSPCSNTTPAGFVFPPSFLQSPIKTVWSLCLRLLTAPHCARSDSFFSSQKCPCYVR